MKEHTPSSGSITLSKLKEEARAIKRASNISHRDALELVARQHGFLNWLAATRTLELGKPSPPSPSASGHAVLAPPAQVRDHPSFQLEGDANSHLLDTGSKVPTQYGQDLDGLMRCALSMAARQSLGSKSPAPKPIGFNFLLERDDGVVLDGGFSAARLIKPHGREWGGVTLRRWMVSHNVRRCAIYMDVRPASKKGLPTEFAIIGMEAGLCQIRLYAFAHLNSEAPPQPIKDSLGDGYWFDVFKMGLAERIIGEVHPGVKPGAFELL